MELLFESLYCIDSCALIKMKNNYFMSVFEGLWNEIEVLIEKGALIAPQEVFDEIERIEDELLIWCRKNRTMFYELDVEQINIARKIIKEYPGLIDLNKETPDADPFIIALAKQKGGIVLTEEKMKGPGGVKIPNVSEEYGIKCLNIYDFFRDLKWKF